MKTIPAFFFFLIFIIIWGCGPSHKISGYAKQNVLQKNGLANAHIGISIYEPSGKKYWYSHQHKKYFIPASNVKIATTYAALKYLGNRIKGLKYEEHDNTIVIEGTGDPTFLHPDFKNQAVLEFLRGKRHILINTENWKDNKWGLGWAWDDYNEGYMTERSALPVYGNVVKLMKDTSAGTRGSKLIAYPSYFQDSLVYADDEPLTDSVDVKRAFNKNQFFINSSSVLFTSKNIPFVTNSFETSRKLLRDTLKTDIRASYYEIKNPGIVISYPLDSVLKPMMHRSDNFLAKQTLLMVSNEVLNVMNDEKIIDTILKTDFKNLPQKPRWVDGSGLSRYNLFSPQDFVFILNKMKDEFGMERMKAIFPTGNSGTLKNYYVADSNFIYAKTGVMSGVLSLSGYLYTKKNKLLVFSVLVNNHTTSVTEVRRAIEVFLKEIINEY